MVTTTKNKKNVNWDNSMMNDKLEHWALINKALGKMPKRSKQDKYTKSAQGQDCQIRSPACNNNPETVVFCHLNGAGMGEKMQNIHGAYGCSKCHDFVDGVLGVVGQDFNTAQRQLYHLKGTIRTQELMIRNGVLKL